MEVSGFLMLQLHSAEGREKMMFGLFMGGGVEAGVTLTSSNLSPVLLRQAQSILCPRS